MSALSSYRRTLAVQEMQWLRQTVLQWVGIPVSIGIAPSKTLAKLANVAAKKTQTGVLDARDPQTLAHLLKMPAGDIWGVGRRWQKKLALLGIETVGQLRDQPRAWLKQNLSIVGVRIGDELHGIPCYDVEEWQPKKSIITARSFGERVHEFADLNAALAQYIVRAAEKARAQHSFVGAMQVFVHQVPLQRGNAKHDTVLSRTAALEVPSSDPKDLLALGTRLLRGLYQKGRAYRKAGVMLCDLTPMEGAQGNLFHEVYSPERQRLLHSIDRVNSAMGSRTLRFAIEDTDRKKLYNRENASAHFTTRWQDIPRAQCG